jgi:signal transduction histidine kinase/CheY-like chemotaxis protein
MEQRKISEKDARRLRVLRLVVWLLSAVSAGLVVLGLLTPHAWRTAMVHAVAASIYASVPLLARRAPLSAMLATYLCGYAQCALVIGLSGTGGGVSLAFLGAVAVALTIFGTQRILLVAVLGLVAGVLMVVLEALVPHNTGLHGPAQLFLGSYVPMVAGSIALLTATVYYAVRIGERAEEALERDNAIIQDKTRQLEVANRHKSHLIASASHDLRQPLHALNLFVARLRDEPDAAERGRLVGRIDAAVGSMNELFGSLLDMTRLDAGIVEPSPSRIPVQRLLDRIETTFGEAARRKGLGLRLVPSRAWVASDPILLERILLNLVANAVRYTERGGVVVGCRHRGAMLRIDVCDTGPGIPADQRQRIFAEFYQLERSGAAQREGLGLGLAIVDRLCHLLGHRVEVGSHLGRGSRFSVTVPLAVRPEAESGEPAPAPPLIDPARGKRIVVIDDDALVRDGMRGILQGWGCEVETAASGAAALARLAADGARPDLIISDSRLADGEAGVDAIERLRAAAGVPIPALVITGDTAPERLREASAAGFPLLHKPVSPMALRTTLNRLLKVSSPRTGAA